jgi:beta-lactamase superfamily II metal-dependent hydrolase
MIHMMDVGQGDALLLTTEEHHNILIDGGTGNTVLSELSEILPESFREIDLMIMTHPHLDHIEGLIPVLERFEVHAILMSAPHYDSLAYDAFFEVVDAPVYFARADTDFRFGDMTLDVVYPFESLTGESMDNINNASPVIKVDDWLLLTGDAEHEVEEQLLHLDLKVDILKAGHHGSRTSTTKEFLELVDPEIVLISAGKDNSFGHPHQETIDKTRDRIVYRTDLDGRVSLGCARSWLPAFLTFPRNVHNLDQCN